MSHWMVTPYHVGRRHIQTLKKLSKLWIYERMKTNNVVMAAVTARGVKIKYHIPKFEINKANVSA